MPKLDEIAELLTEEINGFEKNVGRLEKVHQNLQCLELRPDTAEFDTLLNEYVNNQRKLVEDQNKMMLRILQKVERSILLPSWAVGLLWGLLVFVQYRPIKLITLKNVVIINNKYI